MSVIIDPVHGKVELTPRLRDVVMCPQFQRLRHVRQLGFVPFLYPGTTHTRYEHSIGTAHLCATLLRTLEENSNIFIDDFYKICVIVAGLLHDCGHGPFSHAWEKIAPEHEAMSCKIVERILNKSVPNFFGIEERQKGIELVQSLIKGSHSLLPDNLKYLAEIVSNKFCEIDVDKLDYLLRDLYYLKNAVQFPIDMMSFFKGAKIVKDELGITHIAYQEKDCEKVQAFFDLRNNLRTHVYLHPSVEKVEDKFCEILMEADKNGFRFKGKHIREVQENLDDFQNLDDSIMNHLEIWMDSDQCYNKELKLEYNEFQRLKQLEFVKASEPSSRVTKKVLFYNTENQAYKELNY